MINDPSEISAVIFLDPKKRQIGEIGACSGVTLTSHVDVSGAAHVPPREYDEIEDVADDAEATNGRQHDTVTDPPQGRRSWILQHVQVLRQQADIWNPA